MKNIKFYLTNRFILFILSIILFVIINSLFTGHWIPEANTKDIWFYSGLFMVLFSILFIEPYYTSPKNVITNAIPLFLVYISIKDSFKSNTIWWVTIGLVIVLILVSILVIALSNEEESIDSERNKIANKLKSIVVLIGQGKVIYSIVFISIIFLYKADLLKTISDTYFFVLIGLWGGILLINTKSIHSKFIIDSSEKGSDAVGEIFSVQSNNMFLVRLYEDKLNVKKFDIVRFRYQMSDNQNLINQGIVFDTYNLNKQKWAKILPLNQTNSNPELLKKNTIFKISNGAEKQQLEESLRIESFVGVVIEGSNIGKIKFEYSKKHNDLQEGDLLELKVGANKVFYQVFGGFTESEKLENKDESGYIEGEAIQLGFWNNNSSSFEKYGWVPQINTPLFKANTEDIEIPDLGDHEFKLGTIPGTNLPSILNLDDAVSHHLALVGVTGAGKSFLAKEIIEALKVYTKVICIDFTGEWKKRMSLLSLNKDNIDDFLSSTGEDVGLVELPAVSNTVAVIESTEKFINNIFTKAKAAYDADNPMKVCLVLEEAHTIVPEGNFLGVNDWDSKAIVNKMGQIALQGRKFGVGLLVIAQRTANVSKTVLTQCNTIVCFQAFDETSFIFLGNYIGKDLIKELPNLKRYHAVVTGKAIKSKIPMIVNLERETV